MSAYQGRQFIAFDGEVIGGRYALLADSEGRSIERPEGLTGAECLAFVARPLPGRATWSRVMFGLGLDVNYWVTDMPKDDRLRFFRGQGVDYLGYTLRWVGGRILTVDKRNARKNKLERVATVYDVLGFFRRPFVDVVQDWLGAVDPIIVDGKARRGGFTEFDLDFVRAYNAAELSALVKVMDALRSFLAGVPGGVDLRSWYGPGAIAGSWLRRGGARRWMRWYDEKHVSRELLDIFELAYHGGRVESRVIGTVGPVWRYDLNSAYAWAIANMGRLTYRWLQVDRFNPDHGARMSVWHVKWNVPASEALGPFPMRHNDGSVSYPASGQGWYWWPEVCAALNAWGGRRIKIGVGYVCPDGDLPMGMGGPDGGVGYRDVVRTMYRYRAHIEKSHPAGARVLKLALAAQWGKFAQRKSLDDEPGFFFCLPWAGWVTSCVRAAILQATRGHQKSVLSISTDGIVTNAELPGLALGDNLGAWRVDRFDRGTFLLPGLFRLANDDGSESVEKTRGYERAAIDWEEVLEQLASDHQAVVTVTRFIGHHLADMFPDQWGAHRLRFTRLGIKLNPDAISAKRVGGHVVPGTFDYRTDAQYLGLHPGNPTLMSWPMRLEDDEHDAVTRAQREGDALAAF